MANRLRIRRGTAAAATSVNPLLSDGEWGVETDTRRVKMGDGVTLWNDLDYLAVEGIAISWRGNLITHPASPAINWAYRNTVDKICYIYSGAGWDIMAIDGPQGEQGVQGIDGPQGIQGIQGIQGEQGIQGFVGDNYWRGSDRTISTEEPSGGVDGDFWFRYIP